MRQAMDSRWYWLLALVLAFGLVLTACGGGGGQTPPDQEQPADEQAEQPPPTEEKTVGDVLLYGSIGDASGFNPILVSDTASDDVSSRIFEGLMEVNDQIEWVPALAEDWSFSADGTEWTFNLRRDVRWHDGEPFTAEDVAFTFEAIMHPDYEGVRRTDYDKFVGYAEYDAALNEISQREEAGELTAEEARAEKLAAFETWRQSGAIEIVDDYTIKFRLTEPFAPFQEAIAMNIIPAHVFNGDPGLAGKMDHPFHTQNPIGTGPYKFVSWSRDEQVVLEANPDYWGEGPYVGRWVMRVIPDAQEVTLALETGDLDLGGIQPEEFERMQGVPHLETFEYPTFSYTFMALNLTMPMFQDVRVRQAITHAIDRETIVDQLLVGHGTVAHSHGSPARWDYNPDVPVFEYNPDRARELLAEAGWTDTDGDGILDKDGQPFHFTLQTNQGNKIREDSAVLIQDYLSQVGIDVEVEFVEWNTFVNDHLLAKNFEAIIVGWSLGVDPDAYSIWHTNGGPFNFHSYSNPRVDELLEQGRTELDQERRKEIYAEFQRILAEDQAYTFLYFANSLVGLHQRFEGPISGTPAGIMWNVNEWYVPAANQLRS
ncbi:MAG TPA: peptide-binding protein [Bacillota bacterium]